MISILSPKKVDILFLVMIVVVLAGAYFAIFHRGITRYFYLKTQEKILRKSLESTETIDKTLRGFQKEIKIVQKKLNEFNKKLPKEKNIDEILKQITRASSRTGVHLGLIEPQEIMEGEMYKRFPVKLYLQGGFKNCFHFFSQLESLPRILQLENLTMQSNEKSGKLEIEMLLSAFIQK